MDKTNRLKLIARIAKRNASLEEVAATVEIKHSDPAREAAEQYQKMIEDEAFALTKAGAFTLTPED